ncbi:MAG: 50S ribosome-binding GTPase [Actinobacteria bacterium]|nr:50S ribosome-binding GTPase [Actinomycetota bacterium]
MPPRQQRKELLCRRCFYLKHHNQLPDEHNHIQPIIDETDEKQLLERIFAKKGDTYYFYLIDIFDVCGTLTETVLERLFLSKMQFTLLLSKFDMVNRKYFNYVAMKPQIRQYIVATLDKLKEQGTVPKDYRLEDYMQYIYFISSDNKVGLNKVKKLLEGMACKVQMIGYPNTGKTSLLNAITSQKKPTSTVPGTSLTF